MTWSSSTPLARAIGSLPRSFSFPDFPPQFVQAMAGSLRMKLQEESLPPLDTSLPPSRSRTTLALSPAGAATCGRCPKAGSHRMLLTVCLGIAILLVGGGGAMWFLSRDDASGGRVPIAQDGEIVRITPEAPASNSSSTASTPVVSAAPEFHIVQPGEVLSTIASKYNTTVGELG